MDKTVGEFGAEKRKELMSGYVSSSKSKQNVKSDDSITFGDIKSAWTVVCDEVKEKHGINLNKWVGQIALILVILFAASIVLSWNIGSGAETKADVQPDTGSYNLSNSAYKPSGGDANSEGMITTGVFNLSSSSAQSTDNSLQSSSGYTAVQTTTGVADILIATIGATTSWISLLVLLAVVGIGLSVVMGALFQISRVLGL